MAPPHAHISRIRVFIFPSMHLKFSRWRCLDSKLLASEQQSTNQWVTSRMLSPFLLYSLCVRCITVSLPTMSGAIQQLFIYGPLFSGLLSILNPKCSHSADLKKKKRCILRPYITSSTCLLFTDSSLDSCSVEEESCMHTT